MGKNVKIYNASGTALIGGAKNCVVQVAAEAIEVANASNGTAKGFIAGRTSWQVSLSHLLTTNQGGIPLVGTSYTIKYMVGSTAVYQGTALCTEAEISGNVGNLAQGSIKMIGNGPLSAV